MNQQSSSTYTENERMPKSNSQPCILVVEDDSSVSELLSSILKDWGYHVLPAPNGQDGLEKVKHHAIDGILLDMHMPVMDGRTMLDELRWLGYKMPILVMSGGLDLPGLRQLLREGAQGFLLKPFNLRSLKQTCQQVFGKSGTNCGHHHVEVSSS